MSPQHSSVTTWVQQLREGDKDLPVHKLWERYFERLVHLARAKLGNRPRPVAGAEDVALSAFDSFCRGAMTGKFPDLNDRDNLWRVLVVITARKAYQVRLRNSRKKRGGNTVLNEADLITDGNAIALELFIATEPTPEFAAQAAEQYDHLLALLPSDELRSIAQWKMEGFTNEEIAVRLGCVVRSVERRLRTIRLCWEGSDAA